MHRRDSYHHGDLRRALIEAGTRLARVGGPEAVLVREVTRQAGVAPNAAYRHFADREALLDAVCSQAQGAVAVAMEAELAKVRAKADVAGRARARLRAVGIGYLRFAQEEPGLFRTAFSFPADLSRATSPDSAGASGRTPFQLLSSALDDLVDAGVLPRAQRPGAEFLAWSAVHGLATLAVTGPLRALSPRRLRSLANRLLDMVDRGLPATADLHRATRPVR
jgi:AcrR family transcriptional regulator